jgi:hypothetical protein
MRKVSIALRRLGASEFPSLTRGELRALRRETEPESNDLDLFLKDMQAVDWEASKEDPQAEAEGDEVSPSVASEDKADTHPTGPTDDSEVVVRNSEGQIISDEDLQVSKDEEPGDIILHSREEVKEGLSVTFKLTGNGNESKAGELTIYSHISETQLSGLGDSQDSAFAVEVPPDSFVNLGPGDDSRGWESLRINGLAEVPSAETSPSQDEPAPVIPVPENELPGSLWAIPIEILPKTSTKLALTNALDQPVVVRLYLLDSTGNKLAGILDSKLNPLLPGRQVLGSMDRFFPELTGLTEFYGTIVARVERNKEVWAMGVIGEDPDRFTIRRALNMNVDLEGLKAKMAQELEEITVRETTLQEQMQHLEAVLHLASGNGDPAMSGGSMDYSQASADEAASG